MKTHISRSTWFASALLAVGALGYLCVTRPPAAPRGPLDPAANRRERDELEDRGQDVTARLEARQAILREVIAGRLSLAEAAARFQELDRASSSFNWEVFRSGVPGDTDELKQCHAVILHVGNLLVNDPERARAVTGRLEGELRALRDGAAGHGPAPARRE